MRLTDADIAQMWKARAEAAEAERDDLRKRLQSCAESVCAEERKTVAAEARIAAALALCDGVTRSDAWIHAFTEMIRAALAEPVEPSAKYGVNMTAAAALRELEPQPELAQRQCARCEAFDGHFEWCPSCAPTPTRDGRWNEADRIAELEAERDEALTALGELVIATEHDRADYLALQRVIVERDNENEALRARLTPAAPPDPESETP